MSGPCAAEGQSAVLVSAAGLWGCSKGKRHGQMMNLVSRPALKLFLCSAADAAGGSWLMTKQGM